MLKGKFKTAYDQREIALDIVVAGSADLHVGELAQYVAAANGKPAYLTPAASAAVATHIVAQSDMTMEYGHIPVENRDYRYSDVVARSKTGNAATTVATLSSASETKKVAVFAITDKDDVVVYEVV